jgi:hypothetical protein
MINFSRISDRLANAVADLDDAVSGIKGSDVAAIALVASDLAELRMEIERVAFQSERLSVAMTRPRGPDTAADADQQA